MPRRKARRVPRDWLFPKAAMATESEPESLLDVIDSVLNKGAVVNGDLVLGVAKVDLIYAKLSVLLGALDRIMRREHEGPRRTRRSTKNAKIHEEHEGPRRTRRSTKIAKIHEGHEDPRRARRSTKNTRRSTKGTKIHEEHAKIRERFKGPRKEKSSPRKK
jgi:Gas vesicle protein